MGVVCLAHTAALRKRSAPAAPTERGEAGVGSAVDVKAGTQVVPCSYSTCWISHVSVVVPSAEKPRTRFSVASPEQRKSRCFTSASLGDVARLHFTPSSVRPTKLNTASLPLLADPCSLLTRRCSAACTCLTTHSCRRRHSTAAHLPCITAVCPRPGVKMVLREKGEKWGEQKSRG